MGAVSPQGATDREVLCPRLVLAPPYRVVVAKSTAVGRTLGCPLTVPAAHRLGLSHSTVKHHLANARTKVGARTTAELVWILAGRLPEPQERTEARAGPCEEVNRNPWGRDQPREGGDAFSNVTRYQ